MRTFDYGEILLYSDYWLMLMISCDANFNDLDKGGSRRSHALTEALMDTMDTKTLWDDYGIVDGIMVCLTRCCSMAIIDTNPSH